MARGALLSLSLFLSATYVAVATATAPAAAAAEGNLEALCKKRKPTMLIPALNCLSPQLPPLRNLIRWSGTEKSCQSPCPRPLLPGTS